MLRYSARRLLNELLTTFFSLPSVPKTRDRIRRRDISLAKVISRIPTRYTRVTGLSRTIRSSANVVTCNAPVINRRGRFSFNFLFSLFRRTNGVRKREAFEYSGRPPPNSVSFGYMALECSSAVKPITATLRYPEPRISPRPRPHPSPDRWLRVVVRRWSSAYVYRT